MKRLTHISVFILFLLSSAFCRAESEKVEHDFTKGTPRIEYSLDYKTATTDLLTYTCYGTGTFAAINYIPHLTLPGRNDTVKTTRVDELKRITIYLNKSGEASNIKIYLSKDGVTFGDALSAEYSSSGMIDAGFPRGNYYVIIVNDVASNTFAIKKIDYYMDHCNCFEYVP